MRLDYIEQGDCLNLLRSLPEGSVDLIITSPPYFNLRDYGVIGQIGQEKDVDDYIDNLILIFSEAYRVLKDDGSCYVNIDDVYIKQSLACIPDKFKIKMSENGWLCRNEIVWHKPNAMPSSAKRRFNNDYEKMFFFTKSQNYFFNTQYEPAKTAAPQKTSTKGTGKYESIDQESSVRQGMNKSRGMKLVYLRKNLPPQEEFVSFMRERTSIDAIVEETNLKRTKVEHWFRRDKVGFSFPSVEDWNNIKFLVDDWSDAFSDIDKKLTDVTIETDDIFKNIQKGRIKRAVWSINTKPFKGCHYAPFPEELVKTPILACTSEGDIVLDPFIGSGTTAVAAKKLGRHYIGFDISEEYCDIARKRVADVEEKEKDNGSI